ncbi:hypothetical protein HYV64_05020 [Candidatus Shapirobacteria bacterium]|nr:hypothetical protein [Candidatus Shapirobacteria bacterium]
MTQSRIIPEAKIWPLEKFQPAFPNFPIEVKDGQVAINSDSVICTDMVVCATHRVTLVPDLTSTLTAAKPILERVCPIPECQTRAIVRPKHYVTSADTRQSWNHIKKEVAASHLRIHGPAGKTHPPKP